MTEEKLREIERGLDRWHSVSPDVARVLLSEIRRLNWVIAEREKAAREKARGGAV